MSATAAEFKLALATGQLRVTAREYTGCFTDCPSHVAQRERLYAAARAFVAAEAAEQAAKKKKWRKS